MPMEMCNWERWTPKRGQSAVRQQGCQLDPHGIFLGKVPGGFKTPAQQRPGGNQIPI